KITNGWRDIGGAVTGRIWDRRVRSLWTRPWSWDNWETHQPRLTRLTASLSKMGAAWGTRNTIIGQSTSDFWAMRSSFNGFPSGLRKARSDHADPKYNLRHCCMQWHRFTIVKRKN